MGLGPKVEPPSSSGTGNVRFFRTRQEGSGGHSAALLPGDYPMSISWDREAAAHLARRAGFGATPAELDSLVKMGVDAAVDQFVNYDAIDNSALENGAPGADDRGPPGDGARLRPLQHQRRREVVPPPHGLHAAAARREDDLLLERALHLRDREGPGRHPDAQPEQDAAPVRAGEVRRPRRQDLAGPGHARVARQRDVARRAVPTRTTPAS